MTKQEEKDLEILNRVKFESKIAEIPDGNELALKAKERREKGEKPLELKDNSIASLTAKALEYYNKGYRYKNKILTFINEDGAEIKFDYHSETVFAINQNILKTLEEITIDYESENINANENKNEIDIAETLEKGLEFNFNNYDCNRLVSYNGKFYAGLKDIESFIPLIDREVTDIIHHIWNRTSSADIKKIKDAIKDRGFLKRIPKYVIRYTEPKDNGFRFNKSAYRLIHYYLREDKDAYIMTIMSKGGQGKSTFSKFLSCLFKNEYYSAESKYTNQFSTSFYASSRLTIFNDCTNAYLENTHVLKQISGSDLSEIQEKGQQAYSGYIDAHLLFIGNEDLRYNILDSGLQRRFINLPWDDKVIKESYDEYGFINGYEEINPVKDNKWVKYDWSDEEIMFQIELADKLYEYKLKDEINLEDLNNKTVIKNLLQNPAIQYDNYKAYADADRYAWSINNYRIYLDLIKEFVDKKLITKNDIDKARDSFKQLGLNNPEDTNINDYLFNNNDITDSANNTQEELALNRCYSGIDIF